MGDRHKLTIRASAANTRLSIEVDKTLVPVCMMVADRETHSFKMLWLCAPNARLLDELAKLALTGERDAIAKGV